MKKSVMILVAGLFFSTATLAQESMPEQPMPAESMPAESMPQAEASMGTVARALFTTGVQDREPVDQITRANNTVSTVYFFTELRDLAGHAVTHRWKYNGTVMAEVKFDVGGARWRVFSSKNFVPEWVGEWTVDVVDGDGSVLTSESMTYSGAQ